MCRRQMLVSLVLVSLVPVALEAQAPPHAALLLSAAGDLTFEAEVRDVSQAEDLLRRAGVVELTLVVASDTPAPAVQRIVSSLALPRIRVAFAGVTAAGPRLDVAPSGSLTMKVPGVDADRASSLVEAVGASRVTVAGELGAARAELVFQLQASLVAAGVQAVEFLRF